MVKFEADDAIATAVARFKVKSVKQIVICSVDKDLTQMVDGDRVVCWDRRREIILDEKGVTEKFGIGPDQFPITLRSSAIRREWVSGHQRLGSGIHVGVFALQAHQVRSTRPQAARPGTWARDDVARKLEKELQRCPAVRDYPRCVRMFPSKRLWTICSGRALIRV